MGHEVGQSGAFHATERTYMLLLAVVVCCAACACRRRRLLPMHFDSDELLDGRRVSAASACLCMRAVFSTASVSFLFWVCFECRVSALCCMHMCRHTFAPCR
eukprot:GHRQ01036585.1.p2 GENE.GHRQ01036585.1~~GHRQ01036585.1.p2  ORF type:complete len:102 (-),score=0.54 GHRQ01036585.1:32-337(-)